VPVCAAVVGSDRAELLETAVDTERVRADRLSHESVSGLLSGVVIGATTRGRQTGAPGATQLAGRDIPVSRSPKPGDRRRPVTNRRPLRHNRTRVFFESTVTPKRNGL
jgi:hypothetical protein